MMITPQDSNWPRLTLKALKKQPKQLYYEGDISLITNNNIAIIGAKHASIMGKRSAFNCAKFFSERGYTIVAGLCEGIDTAAHLGSFNQRGKTIAVLATSLEKIHSNREQVQLAHRIVEEGGLLITEYNTPEVRGYRFFERDRLQAAFSQVLIPVQAHLKHNPQTDKNSGTWHTVSFGIEMDRWIYPMLPITQDEKTHPDLYEGIREMEQEGFHMLRNKQDYGWILEKFEGTCE
jgi:DNA processing protein